MARRTLSFTTAFLWLAASAAAAGGTLLVACGSSSSPASPGGNNTTDGSVGSDANTQPSVTDAGTDSSVTLPDSGACTTPSATGFTTATHPALPTVVYGGGGILATPKLITFTFNDTFEAAQLAAYGDSLATTSWFSEVTKDYCVPNGGPCITGAEGSSIAIDAGSANVWVDNSFNQPGSPNSDAGTDFTSFLLDQLDKAVAAKELPAIDPNAVYTFYFSPDATFYMGDPNNGGQPGCGFGGYHSAVSQFADGGGVPVTYAIIVDCGKGTPAADELAGMTVAASHELVEATTDPYDGTGWYLDQGQLDGDASVPSPNAIRDQAWADEFSFGEIGDNCESLINYAWTLDGGSVVQRIWSTSAAAAGQNPCIPVPAGETYFEATPDKAVYVANVGQSFTVDVTGFSTTARAGWAVQAVDQTPAQLPDGGTASPLLSMEFVGGVDAGLVAPGGSEVGCINNGTSAQLKVTLLSDPAQDPALNNPYVQPEWQQAEGLLVSLDTSAQPQGGGGSAIYYPFQVWPFAVVTPSMAQTIGLTSAGLPAERPMSVVAPPVPHGAKVRRTWEAKPKMRPGRVAR